MNFTYLRKGKKIIGKKKKYIPIDQRNRESASADIIIIIVKGQPCLIMNTRINPSFFRIYF